MLISGKRERIGEACLVWISVSDAQEEDVCRPFLLQVWLLPDLAISLETSVQPYYRADMGYCDGNQSAGRFLQSSPMHF